MVFFSIFVSYVTARHVNRGHILHSKYLIISIIIVLSHLKIATLLHKNVRKHKAVHLVILLQHVHNPYCIVFYGKYEQVWSQNNVVHS